MSLRLFTILISFSFLFAGCHDAAAELLPGSGSSGDSCCSADAPGTHGAMADAVLDGCCAACADAPDCACDAGCTNCAECPACAECGDCADCGGCGDCCADCGEGAACAAGSECCADCGDCCACCSDVVDTAKQKLEELAPAGLGEDG